MKLVQDIGNQRFYKVDFDIKKGTALGSREVDVKKEWSEFYDTIKEEYSHNFKKDKVPNIVCISDAKTHIERLVFLGCYIPELETHAWVNVQIGGEHTMMINGGNAETIRDDIVYLRRLKQLNKER